MVADHDEADQLVAVVDGPHPRASPGRRPTASSKWLAIEPRNRSWPGARCRAEDGLAVVVGDDVAELDRGHQRATRDARGPRRGTRASARRARGRRARSRAGRSRPRARRPAARRSAAMRLDVEALVGLEQLERLERQPGPVVRRAGAALAQRRRRAAAPSGTARPTRASGRTRRSDRPPGRTPSSSSEVHLVPARDAPGRHPGVEQLVGPAQQRVQRLGGVALLERAVGELGEVPGRRGDSRASRAGPSQACPTLHLGDDVERPAAGERDGQLGERLEAAAEARRRPADALGDRLELAAAGRDQRQDAVGLAEVEAGQDDGLGGVAARDGHRRDGTTGTRPRWPAAPRDGASGRRRCGRVPAPARTRVAPRVASPARVGPPSTGYLRGTRFVYTRSHDDHASHRHRPRRPHRRHRGGDRAPRRGPRPVDRTACTRWSATTSGSTGPGRPAASGCGRSSASSPTPRSPASTARALPGAAAVELGHNFSLVHDDIEDGDVERRHRPTLWTVHGVPAGDQHRRHAVQPVADRAPPPDRSRLPATPRSCASCACTTRRASPLCEGQYIDIATSASDELDDGRAATST